MNQRQTELDILRFLATLAVIIIHLGRIPYVSACWSSGKIGMSIAPLTWCVPVFFMISGRFFLDEGKPISLRQLFQKYILRLIIAFALWSAVYTMYGVWDGTYKGLNIFGILTQYVQGPDHFWYLYATVGLYLLTPLLRKIARDNTVCIYFLVLFAFYNVVTQYLIYVPKIGAILADTTGRLNLDLLNGYVGCFLLGHILYVNREKITRRWEIVIYLLGAVMLVLTYVLDISISEELQNKNFVKQYQKPNVIIFSAAIYLFFTKRISQFDFSPKTRDSFAKTTEYGFGIYILHALVIEFAKAVSFPEQLMSPMAITFILALGIYMFSFLLTALIRKIPGVGKHLL